MIKQCTCRSDKRGNTRAADYQNKEYGSGNRVFNLCAPTKGSPPKHRCTVCGFTK